jgi:hypothetical protein
MAWEARMPEELLGDDAELRPPSRWRPVAWGALALVLIALGSVLVGRNDTTATFSAGPESASDYDQVVARPLPTDGMTLGLGNNLTVGVACPTRAGAPGLIAVSFRLVNWGQSNVVVTGLRVQGSTHGLRAQGASAGGSCEEPSRGAVGGALTPGGSQLYTFWFRAPQRCPASSRTIALGVRAETLTGTTTKVVSRTVGDVYVATCPATPS